MSLIRVALVVSDSTFVGRDVQSNIANGELAIHTLELKLGPPVPD